MLTSSWPLLHLFSGADGLSRVDQGFTQDLQGHEFAPPAPPMFVGHVSGAEAMVLVALPVGWCGGWHPSPHAQWVICLSGVMAYQAGDGTRFSLQPGSCILTTDTAGQGHKSWNAGTEPIRLVLVQVAARPKTV
jgi:quercetin dioxygenase-like cupin family protein